MKRINLVLAALVAVSSLTACSSAKKEEANNAPAQAAVSDTTPVNLGASSSGRGR